MKNKKIILSSNNAFSIYNFRYGLMKTLEEMGYEIITLAGRDKTAKENRKKWLEIFRVKYS